MPKMTFDQSRVVAPSAIYTVHPTFASRHAQHPSTTSPTLCPRLSPPNMARLSNPPPPAPEEEDDTAMPDVQHHSSTTATTTTAAAAAAASIPEAEPEPEAIPGPRAQRLLDLYARSLSHTMGKLSWDNFAACYPTFARRNEPVLKQIQQQMVMKLKEKCEVRFFLPHRPK